MSGCTARTFCIAFFSGILVFALSGCEAEQPEKVTKEDESKARFDDLKDKATKVIDEWCKAHGFIVDHKLVLARRTSLDDAKLTFWVKIEVLQEVERLYTFYLHFYDGKWCVMRFEGFHENKEGQELGLKIDKIGDK